MKKYKRTMDEGEDTLIPLKEDELFMLFDQMFIWKSAREGSIDDHNTFTYWNAVMRILLYRNHRLCIEDHWENHW